MEFIDPDALATPPDPVPAAAAAAAAFAAVTASVESSLTATNSNPHRLKRLRVASQGSVTSGGVEAFMRGCGKNLIHNRISTCARHGTGYTHDRYEYTRGHGRDMNGWKMTQRDGLT